MTETVPPRVVGLRSAWEVTAGVIPGTPEDSFTRRYFFTNDDPEGRYNECRNEALAYAEAIMDPRKLNWVRLDWIWL